jgi:quaternary ammonium compound-resistance protein SugE
MFSKETVGWLLVVVAGLLEIGWPVCMKYSQGFTRLPWIAAMMLIMCLSFALLTVAVSPRYQLPIGTAYAVWTGLGAAGAAVVGIVLFGEPRDAPRLLCLAMIVLGIVGLKFTHREPAAEPPTVLNDAADDSR